MQWVHNFCLMCKSYSGDLVYFDRLIKTYSRFVTEDIPFVLIISESDYSLFRDYEIKFRIDIIFEEIFSKYLVSEFIDDTRPGYINQMIIKMCFWELGYSKNYFCIDSDAQFIRSFSVADFMYSKDVPFSILVEDNELYVDPPYWKEHQSSRIGRLDAIKKALDFIDGRRLTCHGQTTFNSSVLMSLKHEVLIPKEMSYLDCLRLGPEFSWYNFYLQKSRILPIQVKEPLFKCFHLIHHLKYYHSLAVTIDDIARGYIGLIVNSNFSRGYGVLNYDGSIYKV